jgi:hypothetical protein
VFKNGWVTKVRKRLHTSLYSTLLQREEQEGPRFRFFFLLFFLARCCTPTNLPNVLIISTTCTRPVQLSSHSSQSYTGTIFLLLFFFSFIIFSFSCCTIIRSINVYYASSIPWLLDSRVILFVFSFYYHLWMTL